MELALELELQFTFWHNIPFTGYQLASDRWGKQKVFPVFSRGGGLCKKTTSRQLDHSWLRWEGKKSTFFHFFISKQSNLESTMSSHRTFSPVMIHDCYGVAGQIWAPVRIQLCRVAKKKEVNHWPIFKVAEQNLFGCLFVCLLWKLLLTFQEIRRHLKMARKLKRDFKKIGT